MHGSETYLKFPADQRWHPVRTRQLFRDADVVHVRNNFMPHYRYGRSAPRPLVISHHGSAFRTEPDKLRKQARRLGATSLVATIDLLAYGDELRWLPSPQDVPALARTRDRDYEPGEKLRIAHAPTARSVKSTDEFLRAFEVLERRYPIELVLIERSAWADCIRRKATADIYFDQVLLGYGNNALEAWAMGIPVVAGADPETLARMRAIIGPELPFLEATPSSIRLQLEALIALPALRQEYAERGRRYVAQWHDYPVVAHQLVEIYQGAIGARAAA